MRLSYIECDEDFESLRKQKIETISFCAKQLATTTANRKFSTRKLILDSLSAFLNEQLMTSQMQWLHFQQDKSFTLCLNETISEHVEAFKE